MASLKSLLSVLVLLAFASGVVSRPIIQMFPKKNLMRRGSETDQVCEAWKFSFEVNNLRNFTSPKQCVSIIKHYFSDENGSYIFDSYYAAEYAYEFAKTVKLNPDGKDAWIFGLDDTLLSTLPYYKEHGYGSEPFNETGYYEWARKGDAPSLVFSWFLYKDLQNLGFKIIILTGRDEFARNFTEQNLLNVGFSNWEKLIMRGDYDQGKKAIVYKSERRLALEIEGYRLIGNIGDQWSDLLGSATATRSFKLPNPMYYAP